MNKIKVIVSGPSGPEPKQITMEDVWGKWDEENHKRISSGMLAARTGDKCPYFKDKVPYKSVTVLCDPEQETDVTYWLEYVHGANCVQETKLVKRGTKLAIRSDYQCW